MFARHATRQRTVLLVGRDLHEAERVRRLLPARVAISPSPAAARDAVHIADVVVLEDRAWPAKDGEALAELRELSAARRLALVLSRQRGESGEPSGVPVVERPYRMEEIVEAMRIALLRRRR
jgi:hypothetical protein